MDIESNPYLNSERKQNEIATREAWFNALKTTMGL